MLLSYSLGTSSINIYPAAPNCPNPLAGSGQIRNRNIMVGLVLAFAILFNDGFSTATRDAHTAFE